ncbi:Spo0B domain-containing protein [Alicyclobacillus fastidiosus]|uniref:Spo0B domain-containing protein n=2 Tax=Alicyclobacillus fastidiosus TaxID=392011 RepID=A0ABY6ZN49_9BACL|nr:Spo0B domain-containing protein [Alicyclobacillus fastidiosus]WAH44266.1 Spo0B domain-containing protein [Alicyclobacillus fastidiosus]
MMENEHDTYEANAFRRHRHDVLNELQLIRGYLQLGQMERALGVVDRTAGWLQSLTNWQTSSDSVGEWLMWEAATCPNLLLQKINVTGEPGAEFLTRFAAWLRRVNDGAAQQGVRLEISVTLAEASACVRGRSGQPFVVDTDWLKAFPMIAFDVVDSGNATEVRG